MKNLTINQLTSLEAKTAVVTGGAAGIGAAIARRLHEAGGNIVIGDIDEVEAQKILDELNTLRPNSVIISKTDVSKASGVEALFSRAMEVFSSLDILVNNAGIFPLTTLANLTEDQFMRVIDINLRGVYLCTKRASEIMKAQKKGGNIITVCSVDSLHPSMVGLAAYDASKHGVWGFIKNVALELAPHNIRVNGVAPGGTATPGIAKMSEGQPVNPKTQKAALSAIPMARYADPDEIARVTLFLASELSSYMTGSLLVADGGVLLT